MKAMSTNTHFIDHVVSGLRATAEELEKFQLQLGLGKLEAREIYENLKKDYNHASHALMIKIDQGKQMTTDLRTKYDQFLLQLALGKAETMEQFEEQRAKILFAIHEIKVAITTHPTLVEIYNELVLLLEKLEIKLEMLRNNWQPTTDKLKKEFTERKVQIEEVLSNLKSKLAKYNNIDERLDVFNKEMSEAYSHFKKAFAG
jgi:DNA repair exonuclease SbcCD ATPase subunit